MKKKGVARPPVAESGDTSQICFGFDRETDEQSLLIFLENFLRQDILKILVPRMSDQEISGLVNQLTGIMHKHLSKGEYHQLFLTGKGAEPGE